MYIPCVHIHTHIHIIGKIIFLGRRLILSGARTQESLSSGSAGTKDVKKLHIKMHYCNLLRLHQLPERTKDHMIGKITIIPSDFSTPTDYLS